MAISPSSTAPREELAHPHLCLDCGGVIPIWCLTALDFHDFRIRCEPCDATLRALEGAALDVTELYADGSDITAAVAKLQEIVDIYRGYRSRRRS